MKIPRSYIEAYSAALNGVSEQGKSALSKVLEQVDYSRPVAEVRAEVVAIMQQACGASSIMAARLAAEFYDGLRARFGIDDGYQADPDPGYNPDATDGAVRAFAQELEDGDPERFKALCDERIDYETRRTANECMERNARRDPKKPKWARVPTGACTCDTCIMMASRGFAYHNEEMASHSHPNCDCHIVSSWDKKGASVEGYDPNYYKDCYEHPENHPEIRDAINARRRELRAEKKLAARARDYHVLSDEERAEFQSRSDALYESMSPDERWAMDRYTREWFTDMNQELRGNAVDYSSQDNDYKQEDILRAINGVDSVMPRYEIDRDLISFRGDSARWYSDWEVGDIRPIAAFFSTALDERDAQNYYDEVKNVKHEEPIMIEVRVPYGTIGMYIGSNTDITIDYPDVTDETELLLAHGLKFRVVERNGNRMVLEVVG